MVNRLDLKTKAKEQIKGNIGMLFACGLIYCFIGAITILAPAMGIGLAIVYLSLTQGKAPDLADLFKGFNVFGKALWLYIIVGFFTFLWSMLFLIPGIIKAISYSMSPYVLAENPGLTAREALNESKRIMNGHKMDFFVLSLSFFWWYLLCSVTFGLAGIYVMPYIQATNANFYNSIKAN